MIGARPVPAIDTGVAARDVADAADPTIAAIAPTEAAQRYGLVELASNIADHPDNITRFLLVEAAKADERTASEGRSRRTSVLFATAHEHGILARCLAVLADAGVNLTKLESRPRAALEPLVLLLSPFAPHLAEELWSALGHTETLAYEPWPTYEEALTRAEEIEVPVQINGKLRSKLRVPASIDEEALKALALADEKILGLLEGKQVRKVIVVPKKLVNIVVG